MALQLLRPARIDIVSQPILSSQTIGLPSQSVKFSFKTSSSILANGYLLLTLPSRFKTDLQVFWYLNANYTVKEMKINGIDELSNIEHSLINDEKGSSYLKVVLKADQPALSSYELEISEFNNPIQQGDNVLIEAFDNLGYKMDWSYGYAQNLLMATSPSLVAAD